MPDPIAPTAPTAAPATQSQPKQTANNIAKAIHDKVTPKAPAAPPTPPQAKPNEQANTQTPPDPNAGKQKYVVDGKEMWLTPDQAHAYVQKGLAFDRTTDQLGRLQQEQAALVQALIKNPGQVLSNLAKQHNIPIKNIVDSVLSSDASEEMKDAVGEWYYHNRVAIEKLTPEQRKAMENEKKLSEFERQEKERAEAAIRQENRQRVENATGQLKGFIAEAMKESGLPDNNTPIGAEMARMVADTIRVATARRQAITPKQAIEFVKQRVKAVNTQYFETLEDDALATALGDTIVGKIQKYLLKKAQANGAQIPQQNRPARPAVRHGERKVITPDEMHDYLADIKKTGSIPGK